jgi:hypothetical protein
MKTHAKVILSKDLWSLNKRKIISYEEDYSGSQMYVI